MSMRIVALFAFVGLVVSSNADAQSNGVGGEINASPGGFLSCGDAATPGTLPTCQMTVNAYDVDGTFVLNPPGPVIGDHTISMFMNVAASETPNKLSVLVSGSGFSESPQVRINGDGHAVAYDRFTISGGTGMGYVSFTGGFSGSFSAVGSAGTTGGASANYQIESFSGASRSGELCSAGVQDLSTSQSGSCTTLLPFTFGVPFDFQQTLGVSAAFGFGCGPVTCGGTASVTADFSHTAQITNISVFDANMRAVPNASVIADSGVQYPVTTAALTVSIDIKPGESPNALSLSDHGVLPVAILGSATFDATKIDPSTLEVGGVDIAMRGSTKAPKLAYAIQDVNGDGQMDLVAFFDVQALVNAGTLTTSTRSLTLTGKLTDGTFINGTDSIVTVP